uniref:Uncharacterized protein n=1 Tax=Guillardia theta TaxID=55529 RepID=A0A7S4KZE8_GUITH|mmetsp:Transcript_34322/g.107583  ORF Transcript_34322/g.107583 Transcript_34322/m.107583 type:complete len:674 (+) Transcript_34322:195-2216(+)
MQATRRPFSAPLRPSSSIRPKSAKTPKLSNLEDHCARLRQLSSLAKTPSADKETFLAVVDALENVDASRKNADASSRALAEELEEVREHNMLLQEQMVEMVEKLKMYERVHIIAEVVNKTEIEASLRDINAAILRYSGTMKGGSEEHEIAIVPPAELDKHPASSTSRPSSPSLIAKQSEMATLLRKNREEREDTLNETTRSAMSSPATVMEGIDTMLLLQDKLKALEKLVFVLKKRVIMYESNEELFNLMNKYSSVHSLLDKTTKINQENEKLRLRELRFQSEPLLRWRVCSDEKSREVLPSILLVLQNELAAYKSIVDKHALEETKRSEGSDSDVEFVHIDDILQDNLQIMNGDDGHLTDKIDFLHPASEDDMTRKLNLLELNNTNLLKKIDRMKEERKVQLEYLEVKEGLRVLEEEAKDIKSEEERLLNKEKKIAKLSRLNDSLMKQIGKWETALQSKSDAVDELNEVIASLSSQKKQLEETVVQLNKRCDAVSEHLRKSNSQLNVQSARLRSLIDLSSALALSVLPLASIPEENRRMYVGFLYREWMRAESLMLVSTIRLQKCVRGHIGRSRFKRRMGRGELPTPWQVATALKRSGSPAVNGGGGGGGEATAAVGKQKQTILEYVQPLCRILSTLPEGIRTCAATHQLVKISSMQVRSPVDPQTPQLASR